MEKHIQRFIEMINASKNIVFFGGAGVSTESGIPDFRSPDGLYNQKELRTTGYEPEYLLSKTCLYHEPKAFYDFYKKKMDCRKYEPNVTHMALAQLEREGKLSAVVTQNIDGLHQKAGSKNVIEIHGTTKRNYCCKCHREYDENAIFDSKDRIPKCVCGGMIRPDITLYGELLPKKEVEEAALAIGSADMLIIGGTSLSVFPAANLVSYFNGESFIIINKGNFNTYRKPDLIIENSLGSVFSHL